VGTADKILKKNPKLTVFLTALFVILLVIYGFNNQFGHPFVKQSTATIALNSNMLNIHFDITDQDLPQAQLVLQRLGASKFNDIQVEIDQETAKNFSQFLPLVVNLHFTNQTIQFDGPERQDLASTLPRDDYSMASGAAHFHFKNSGQIDFKAQDPGPLLDYATRSGSLQISLKLIPVLKVLGKIDTIEIHSANNRISGEILLK
jgi:hypothetical protein